MATEIRVTSESSSHYYTIGEHGPKAFYEVEYADKKRKGQYRSATIKDARKIGAFPSANQALSRIAKPAIENWKIAKYLEEALTFPLGDRQPADVIPEIMERVKEELDRAPSAGTDIHADIAGAASFLFDNVPYQPNPDVDPAIVAAAMGWCQEFEVAPEGIEEMLIDEYAGYGGRIDLYGSWRLDGELRALVLDWKSQETTPGRKVNFWPDWPVVLAAYGNLALHEAEGGIAEEELDHVHVVLSRNEPGRIEHKVWPAETIQWAWELFMADLNAWFVAKKYDPRKTPF